MGNNNIHLMAFSGSLRKGSLNTALLKATAKLLPEGVTMEIISIADVPFYNGDEDEPNAPQRPETVRKLREAVAKADGLVIASPEYNYSIPGVLKNTIDWLSRGSDQPLKNKPVALMGASDGLWGTVRMQMAFLPLFLTLGMDVAAKPEIMIANANTKLDIITGTITDPVTVELVKKKIVALVERITKSHPNE